MCKTVTVANMPSHIFAVPPWQAHEAARCIPGLMELAWSRGCDKSPEEMLAAAAEQHAVMWLIGDRRNLIGVCFTEIGTTRPTGVWVVVTGGIHGLAWAHALRARLHTYRKAEGLSALLWRGRKGWARLFGLRPIRDATGYWYFEDFG